MAVFGFLEKLIDVCGQGVGALTRPWMIRRTRRAEALSEVDRLKLLAAYQAEVDEEKKLLVEAGGADEEAVLVDRAGELAVAEAESMANRIEERRLHREARRQINLERIMLGAAADALPDDEVSQDPVDDDWIARFFNAAQEVTNDDLQKVWSRLLAREVAKPGCVSLRTLEVLRNLSPQEARLFDEWRVHFCETPPQMFLPGLNGPLLRPLAGFQEAGLVSSAPVSWGVTSTSEVIGWKHRTLALHFRPKQEGFVPWSVSAFVLTAAGVQLSRISTSTDAPSWLMLEEIARTHEETFHTSVVTEEGNAMPLRDYLSAHKPAK
jgi:hypothetical protein